MFPLGTYTPLRNNTRSIDRLVLGDDAFFLKYLGSQGINNYFYQRLREDAPVSSQEASLITQHMRALFDVLLHVDRYSIITRSPYQRNSTSSIRNAFLASMKQLPQRHSLLPAAELQHATLLWAEQRSTRTKTLYDALLANLYRYAETTFLPGASHSATSTNQRFLGQALSLIATGASYAVKNPRSRVVVVHDDLLFGEFTSARHDHVSRALHRWEQSLDGLEFVSHLAFIDVE